MNSQVLPPFERRSRLDELALAIRRWPLGVHLLLAVNVPLALLLLVLMVFQYRDTMNQAILEKETGLAAEAVAVHQAVSHLASGHSSESAHEFIERFRAKMQNTRSTGHAILVMRGDQILHGSEHGRITVNADRDMLQMFRSGKSRQWWKVESTDELIVLGGYEDAGTTVIIAELATDIHRAARAAVLWQLVVLTMLALVAAAIMGAVLWRLIRSPLRRMSATVDTIARGEFGVLLESPVGRELQNLTRSFNTMSDALATDKNRRQREIQRAREIQQQLLPSRASVPGLTIASDYRPAEAVAGDYYDLLPLADGSWLIVIADVAGHGISAAMAATLLKALLLCESENCSDLTVILSRMNRRLGSLLPTGVFVTLVLAAWNPLDSRLSYVNAGHPAGLLWNPSDGFRELASSTFPIGMMPETRYVVSELTLTAEDRLVLFTDGLLEVFSPEGTLFGTDRLKQLIVSNPAASPAELLSAILDSVQAFSGDQPLHDDLTLLVGGRV
jgi:sigma-B regulation protein RsbU (phosphoserine phosphatase)